MFAVIACLLGLGLTAPSEKDNSHLPPLTYNETSFFLDGKPIQLLAGQMDPQRIPRELWRDRLKMAKAMGLNTILTYPFWDLLEPEEGQWDFSGMNDIAEYFRMAGEEGLMASLRIGPYVCGEHTWGGYPYWLANKEGGIRTHEGEMMDYYRKYMEKMYEQLHGTLASEGGNVIMVQIENEYGSYSNNSVYKEGLRDMAIDIGFDVPLYTTDQRYPEKIVAGNIPKVLQEVNGGIADLRENRNAIPVDSSKGPFMNIEYYTHWYDQFNSTYDHRFVTDDVIETVTTEIRDLITDGGSLSLYVFHGGTNFGFQAGAMLDEDAGHYLPTASSYDYGAPLDESGRTTKLYDAIREVLVDFWKTADPDYVVPEVPEQNDRMAIDSIDLKPCKRILDNPTHRLHSVHDPINMELLGQSDGFLNFRKTIEHDVKGELSVGDKPRDRVIVYVNNQRKGLLDIRFLQQPSITLDLKKGDVLDLFIENQGRVNFGHGMDDQRKGIVGDVSIDNNKLNHWEVYSFPFNSIDPYTCNCDENIDNSDFTPTIYKGEFTLSQVEDTFLSTEGGWTKGMVWINGHNLGKYWTIGPQQQLYIPKPWLNKGQNQIAILELVGTNTTQVNAVKDRSWYNNPDPEVK